MKRKLTRDEMIGRLARGSAKMTRPTSAKGSLVDAAKQAVEDIFSDTSVSPSITLERLEEVEEDISSRKDAIREDLRRACGRDGN